jgi:hypothetical protein
MKYNKPKHIKTDKPKRFKPPEGLNPYKEVYRARLDSPYKEVYRARLDSPYKEVYRARLDSPYKEEILCQKVTERNS